MVDDEIDVDFSNIQTYKSFFLKKSCSDIKIKLRIHKDEYKEKVAQVIRHIKRGDIYEANFCQEFFSHGVINPLATFYKLQKSSQPPFSAYIKNGEHFALSASPERYLKKNGNISFWRFWHFVRSLYSTSTILSCLGVSVYSCYLKAFQQRKSHLLFMDYMEH